MQLLSELDPTRFESVPILKQLNAASRALAEFSGLVSSIPNEAILINTLGLQEAKDSSAMENIVTTHDELYGLDLISGAIDSPAAKEVHRYRQALTTGFRAVRQRGLITTNLLCDVQTDVEATGTAANIFFPPLGNRYRR